jgi:outer membrane protein
MNIKLSARILGGAAILAVNCAFADDLVTVYNQALDSDPELRVAGLKLEISEAQKGQALGEMLPQVTGTANWSANNQRVDFTGSITKSNYHGTRYLLSVNQTLIDFAKFWNWRRAQQVENQYAAENTEAQHALIYNVVEKYFDVLEAEDQLVFYQSEREATEKQLEQVKKQYDKQLLKITDLYQVEARLDSIKADEIEAETYLVIAKESLRAFTNSMPDGLLKLRDDIDYLPLEGQLDDWIAVAKSENPTMAAQQSAIEAASNDVAAQRSRHLPVVDLQFNYYNTDTGYQSSRTPKTEVQVAAINVTVPIFSGGIALERTYEAQHRLALAETENEAKMRALVKETSDAYLSSNASVRRIEASTTALVSSRKSREAKEKGFRFGVETVRDVLDARQGEYKAMRDLAQAKYSYIKNRFRFLRAIGLISTDNLQEVNAWLDKS